MSDNMRTVRPLSFPHKAENVNTLYWHFPDVWGFRPYQRHARELSGMRKALERYVHVYACTCTTNCIRTV